VSSRVLIGRISPPISHFSFLSGVREPDEVRDGEGGGNALEGSLAIGLNDLDGVLGPGLYMSLEWWGWGYRPRLSARFPIFPDVTYRDIAFSRAI
jgi:hypothetical protein